MQYTIRKAMQADVPAVAGIYDRILLKEEAGQVTIGWLRGVYPTEQTARAALAADDLFVMEADGVICATARINQVQVPEYRNADWRYADVPENEIMVLHTLVVDPGTGGHGCGKAFVAFYEQYAIDHGCAYLRMDTNAINVGARRFYAKLGFWEAGIVECTFNGIPGCKAGVSGKEAGALIFGRMTEEAQENTDRFSCGFLDISVKSGYNPNIRSATSGPPGLP